MSLLLRSRIKRNGRLTVLPNGIFVATIADGAGSAIMAERGADIAVKTVMAYVAHAVGKESSDVELVLRESAGKAREAVFAAAASRFMED